MKEIDLHTHSTFSDGTCTPSELVELAAKKGLAALALTDHDTVAGLDEFLTRGQELGIEVMTGIEISASHGDISMHILGYGFDHHNPELHEKLEILQESRLRRNEEIFTRLQGIGYPLDLTDIDQLENGQTGRPHIARLLVRKGIVRTIDEAFYRYLRKDALAYAPKKKFSAGTALEMIIKAGGVAVLAHPGTMDHELVFTRELLVDLKKYGLKGVETLYPSHTAKNRRLLDEMALDMHLITTGGSDFHGDTKPANLLGRAGRKKSIPYEIITRLRKNLPA